VDTSQIRSRRRQGALSSSEAAAELGVCERTLRRYIEAGLIGYHRLPGGHYRIPENSIAAFWARQERRPSARRVATPSTRQAPPVLGTRKRRTPIGTESEDADYDLSDKHLAELRSRVQARAV
jgi:excisionase family DNA binding protein